MVKYPFLNTHPMYKVAKKQMKAGGSIVAFEVKGGLEAGKKFFNAIEMLSLSANLGDSRSIVTHPASTTHSKLSASELEEAGISEGLIRISVGLEHINDIIADIDQALAKANA
jgi:O-succinylhomoserine sulfhydrylase